MSKKVTMRDVAAEMKVSVVSVSKALSEKEGVSELVRVKIKDKAKEMGYVYVPSSDAEKKDSRIFGVIVSNSYISDSAFYSKLYQNIVIEFGKKNHSCIMEILSYKDEIEGRLPKLIENKQVDGIIILGPIAIEGLNHLIMHAVPMIFLDTYMANTNIDAVVSDSVYGSYLLTNYLIAKGHKKIAFVGNRKATNSIMDRFLGYYKSMIEADLPIKEGYIINDRSIDGVLSDLEIPKEIPEAFVCNCDEIAVKLIEILTEQGYQIPEDISVVGFDDYMFATLSKPQLTTYHVDMKKMAEEAVYILEKKIEDSSYQVGRRVVSGSIVLRDSVKNRKKNMNM